MPAIIRPFLLLALLCTPALAYIPYQPLLISSRESYTPNRFHLDDPAWRWLGEKQVINVAVWRPSIPPLDIFTEEGRYEGITADYLLLISQYLGLRVSVHEYPNREAAIAALNSGAADLVVDPAGKMFPLDSALVMSERLTSDNPVLVHPHRAGNSPFQYEEGMQLAVSQWYLDYAWLEKRFPRARILRFESDDAALASVAFGDSDFYIGSLVATTYLLDRNYSSYLEVQESYPELDTGSRLVLRKDQEMLLSSINRALAAIPDTQHQVILQQWGERADLWRVRKKIAFNGREQKWLAANPIVKVSVNKFYAPFTTIDAKGNFYGVTADVLRLIQLRTGLRFQPVPADAVDDMLEHITEDDAAFVGAISESGERGKNMLFSRPYFTSPFVLVVKAGEDTSRPLAAGARVALVKGNALQRELQAQFPGIEILDAPNANLAMQWVDEGKADAAVNNLFGATYMIDHYFKGRLQVAGRVGKEMAAIRFAVGRDQPELLSILNKSLESISPNNMSGILTKWQTRPDVQLNTWELYRTQFWLVGGGATALVLSSLLWIFYLRREVAARRKAQQGLQSQLKFNETLLNSVPIPLYVVDRHGELVMSNPSWRDFFHGDSPDRWLRGPRHGESPLHEAWKAAARLFTNKAHHNRSDTRTVAIFDGERQRTVVHYAVTYARPDSHAEGLICAWMDITEHEALAKALFEARENAEQANRAKSTFLATMSHEIRTPVSAIIGLLELAVQTSGKADDSEDPVRVAWESARSLMGVIGDILDMARIESGRLELSPEWLRTTELLPPVVRVFEGLARQKSLRLRSSLPAVLPYEIFVDPLRIRQVISNLVSNAVKFTEQGGIDIDLDITALPDGRVRLHISVQDSGCGIDEAAQRDIFDPWVQAQNGSVTGGSGLGLAICAQLVNMMGGEISMVSRPGQGTTVSFSIPVEQHNERPVTTTQATSEPVGHHVELRILIVDDHPANRLLLRRQLTHLGHHVTEAQDGEQGWALWRQERFELVITDCSMPGMDGLVLTRLIREHQTHPTIVMGLTANAWPEERIRCKEAGMDDCLFKPMQLQQLQAMLADVTQRLHPQQAEAETERSVALEALVNYEGLRALAQQDDQLMRELLSATLGSNLTDLQAARECLEREEWQELAKCIHRISGAAQIVGAQQAAQCCINLERLCQQTPPEPMAIRLGWQATLLCVEDLNQAIDGWLAAR
ncbi:MULTISPECIES: response regulator [Enterobacter]|uniref:histidine kinase n=1 Tax=Enterobacter bugandensis TaxID=881260 RepID=A0ABX4VDK6_9ENTR|nr:MULTISPECIES: transporter substrate-binding domain-containing protein [Enterobacter]ELK6541416.1 transporter substrate-binding domain-containing protein [Enterobacter bugandensis]MBZ6368801.1 transporter substrate-binding domain-containing protein [Enterobacter bugandensis]MCK6852381.1 transporter substrate-binding domain-containing protein [Enterobacter bugandensis]NUX28378.1 transporter substrate-binding domain-containing protein [Enterobacter bugandensis]NUX51379.1 transporter substrate-